MKPLTSEWVEKAEKDWNSLRHLLKGPVRVFMLQRFSEIVSIL
jgi:hypothetical protein